MLTIKGSHLQNTAETIALSNINLEKVSKPMKPPAYLLGVGSYLPLRLVQNEELLKAFPEITEEYIWGVTGIRTRYWIGPEEKPSDLAHKAALQAIENSGLTAEHIDGIIVATTTPDIAMPSMACILQNMLGIKSGAAFDLNAACSGWLYGITVAHGLIATGIANNILVIGVDAQSQLLDKTDLGTYFLFGDGAGAAVISSNSRGHRIVEEYLQSDSSGINLARRMTPGYIAVQKPENKIDPYIRMDGHALFRFATSSFTMQIQDMIAKCDWKPEMVKWVVPHQANRRILKAAAGKSGVPFDRFYLNMERVGNTSSASIPIALTELEKTLQKNDRLILCSVGAGITAATIAVEW